MNEQPQQEWRIEIGKVGHACHIFLNGTEIGTRITSADLHLEAGRPSILDLRWAEHIRPGMPLPEHPTFRNGDILVAEGTPLWTYIEMDGRRFRLMDVTEPGDLDDGLFRERGSSGDDHQSL